MRRKRTLLALLVLGGIGALFVAPSAYSLGQKVAKQVTDVFVTNDANNPVPASIVGQPSVNVANSPTVTISGTPSVQVVSTPFQEFVAETSTGSETCQPITIPDGKTLTITSFNAEASTQTNRQPDVYLLTTVKDPNGVNLVRSLHLVLQQDNPNLWSGDVQTTMYSGNANDPTGVTYSYAACIQAHDSQGDFFGTLRGFVSGTLS